MLGFWSGVVAMRWDKSKVPNVSNTAPRGDDPRRAALLILFALVALMWVVEVVDVALDHRLDRYGIEPRDVDGLDGVVAAPFLHVGFGHLLANTIPFVTMGIVIALEGARRLVLVTVIVALISGFGTWLVASPGTIHVGASGIVFGYAAYLIARGVFNRSGTELAVGAAVVLVWGAALLGGLQPQRGISWQGHLFGAIGGVLAASLLAKRPEPKRPPRPA
jgi:membrane associated rhomboid family serine protease